MTYKFYAIVTTYKRPKLLRRALDSIVNQTYTNWYIVIATEDLSEDTWNVIRKYKQKYPQKVSAIKIPPHLRGQDRPRLLPIELLFRLSDDPSRDFVFFLDDDDFLCDRSALKKAFLKIVGNQDYDMFAFPAVSEDGVLKYGFPKDCPIGLTLYLKTTKADLFGVTRLSFLLRYWNLFKSLTLLSAPYSSEELMVCLYKYWGEKNKKREIQYYFNTSPILCRGLTDKSLTRFNKYDDKSLGRHLKRYQQLLRSCSKVYLEKYPCRFIYHSLAYARILAMLGYKSQSINIFRQALRYALRYRSCLASKLFPLLLGSLVIALFDEETLALSNTVLKISRKLRLV